MKVLGKQPHPGGGSEDLPNQGATQGKKAHDHACSKERKVHAVSGPSKSKPIVIGRQNACAFASAIPACWPGATCSLPGQEHLGSTRWLMADSNPILRDTLLNAVHLSTELALSYGSGNWAQGYLEQAATLPR